VLHIQHIVHDSHAKAQVLIPWNIGGLEAVTWEYIKSVKSGYPSFILEDKVDVKGQGIVTCEGSVGRENEKTKLCYSCRTRGNISWKWGIKKK